MIQIDIDMPNSCNDCPFTYEDSYLKDKCQLTFNEVWHISKDKRDEKCPLIEVNASYQNNQCTDSL